MRFDVAALGELLVDFTPAGRSAAGMALYERNPGGAPANALCALARLGMRTAFIGKVGADAHGDFLRETLRQNHVETRGLVADKTAFTTLAFVDLSPSGERSFSFARKPGADTLLRPGELDRGILENCRVFHFGSLSLTGEPAKSATLEALRIAGEAGAVISYDPNYRAPLWPGEAEAAREMRAALRFADVVKLSAEEAPLVTGARDLDGAARFVLEQGASCVVITLGKDGAEARTRTAGARLAPPEAAVVDTTGAGDAFWGAFLCRFLEAGGNAAALGEPALRDAVAFANAAASFCVARRGAIPAMPSRADLGAFFPA